MVRLSINLQVKPVINGKKIIAIIPARGGSKALSKKNVRLLGGKPLIAWTIEAARGSRYLDRVILSSDDDEIISVAAQYECDIPFKRDSKLAADDTPSIEVVIDALTRCPGYDCVVLLQPTSPLRTSEDIDRTIEQWASSDASTCVTVCMVEQSPYWMFKLEDDARLVPLIPLSQFARRQDLPPVYVLNGAVYVARTAWLLRERAFVSTDTVAYVMPGARSIDIDTEEDLLRTQSAL
jgi:N-acylneuraminate cytidylyltransferase